MKPVDDDTLEEIESAIGPAIKAIKQYLAYEGANTIYRDRARIGIGVVGAFARVRASESNRLQVELIGQRISGDLTKWNPNNSASGSEKPRGTGFDDTRTIQGSTSARNGRSSSATRG